MRAITFCLSLMLLVAPATHAQAQDNGCAAVIANAERSKTDMAVAAATYFHGKFMGKPCVDVDYARAFELAEKSGLGVETFLGTLRERAEQGNSRAISALKTLGY